MRLAIDWPSSLQPAPQLCLLLHGEGSSGAAMQPLAEQLHLAFPDAAILAPDLPQCAGDAPWTAGPDRTDSALKTAIDAELLTLRRWVGEAQHQSGAGAAATSIFGFSRGAMLALELAQRHNGLAGRVLSFGGAYAGLPTDAPRETTLHFLHGGADDAVPATQVRQTLQQLALLQADATLDMAEGIGHELHPALIDLALHRLRTYIPHRTWQAALGAAPIQPTH